MPKLSDTQTILMSTASQRDDRHLYPLPASLKVTGGTIKSIAALIKAGFAEQRGHEAVFATAAGLAAIGVQPEADTPSDSPLAPAVSAPRVTKSATILDLLRRDEGATLPELIETTGWLPHTTRAALTGLRKKGHAIERYKRDEATCYRIAG